MDLICTVFSYFPGMDCGLCESLATLGHDRRRFLGSGVTNAVYSTLLGFMGSLCVVWYISKALGLQSGARPSSNIWRVSVHLMNINELALTRPQEWVNDVEYL